jgi:hypothetical protein
MWASGHVQGIAVDVQGGYIYYSFTNLLAKYDFSGKLSARWSAGRATWAISTSIPPTARSTARWSTRKTRPSTSP